MIKESEVKSLMQRHQISDLIDPKYQIVVKYIIKCDLNIVYTFFNNLDEKIFLKIHEVDKNKN